MSHHQLRAKNRNSRPILEGRSKTMPLGPQTKTFVWLPIENTLEISFSTQKSLRENHAPERYGINKSMYVLRRASFHYEDGSDNRFRIPASTSRADQAHNRSLKLRQNIIDALSPHPHPSLPRGITLSTGNSRPYVLKPFQRQTLTTDVDGRTYFLKYKSLFVLLLALVRKGAQK